MTKPIDLLAAFPALARIDSGTLESVLAKTRTIVLDAGSLVFEAGQKCQQYLLVHAGSVRVHLLDPDGHEIVLYRLGKGDTCILTTAALLSEAPYAAYAVTETRTVATAIPTGDFETLIAQSAGFRQFVFSLHGRRIAALMQTIADVAFTRIQMRLARCLLQRADEQGRVGMTHEALANELGTAREVVSRNLKILHNLGTIQPGQARIDIVDGDRLAGLAKGTET